MKKQDLQAVLVDQKELFLQKTGLIERDIPLDSFLRTSQVVKTFVSIVGHRALY